jgi:L-malate glycosyltransferase
MKHATLGTRRVRVLHSLAAVTFGGVEQRRLILARELDRERYEQLIIAREASGWLAGALREHGVHVVVVGGVHSLLDGRALWRSIAVARDFRPDIVHGAVFEGISAAVAAGRLSGARVVVEETSHATNRSARGHALFRAFAAGADACVAVSPAVGEYLYEVTNVPRSKITVITNGVTAPRVPSREDALRIRTALGLTHDAFVVGTVGRIDDDDHKRYSDLVRAVELTKTSLPELRLLVVGEGRQRQELEQLAQQLGVADRVCFTGARSDVGSMYAVMDVFSLVSDREAFGLVLPEAMMCSLPVVATAVGGMKDIVVHDKTGLLVAPREPAEIASAISRLHASPALRDAFGKAGKARAVEHYGAARYARDVDQFYQRLLSARSRGRADGDDG